MNRFSLSACVLTASVAGLLGAAGTTFAQAGTPGQPTFRTTGNPAKDNLLKLQRPITVELTDRRVEDIVTYFAEVTGAEFEPLWKSDTEQDGLDKDQTITINAKGLDGLTFLEKFLAKTGDGLSSPATWQINSEGQIQIGPRARLNKFKRTEIYDINDLLFVLPMYDNAPQVDLEKVLQSGQGGSSGSPFKNLDDDEDKEKKTKQERAEEVIQIITEIVEPENWTNNGGEGGTITYREVFSGQLIIHAADYLHRGVNGYRWWPNYRPSNGGASGGRRFVSLNLDTSINQLERPLRTLPITGIAGGAGGGGNPPAPPGGG